MPIANLRSLALTRASLRQLNLNMLLHAPILALPMQEGEEATIYDISGNGSNGVFGAGAAAPTWVQLASHKWSLDFDGGDHVALPLALYQAFSNLDDFTIRGWFYVNGTIAGVSRTIFSLTEAVNNRPQIVLVQLGATDRIMALVRQSADVTTNAISSAGIPSIGWHFAALRHDASDNNRVYLQLDDVNEGSDNTHALTFAGVDFNSGTIGCFKIGTNYWVDKLALTVVCPVFLSEDELRDIYNRERPCFEAGFINIIRLTEQWKRSLAALR